MRAFVFCFLMIICLTHNVTGQSYRIPMWRAQIAIMFNSDKADSLVIKAHKRFSQKQRSSRLAALYCNNLGYAFDALDDNEKAVQYYKRAINILESKKKINQRTLAFYCDNLADELEDNREAITWYKKILDINQNRYSDNHPKIADTYEDLSRIYLLMEDTLEHLHYEKKALKIWRANIRQHPLKAANSYYKVAKAHYSLGHFEDALEHAQRGLEIGEDQLKFIDLVVFKADCYILLHDINVSMGNMKVAYEFVEKVKEIMLIDIDKMMNMGTKLATLLKMPHDTMLFEVAHGYAKIGDFKRALKYEEIILKNRKRKYGNKHPEVALSYERLAHIHQKMKNYPKALNYIEKALVINKKHHGENHINVASTYHVFSNFYAELEDAPKAKEYNDKAYNIIHNRFDIIELEAMALCANLANYYGTKGEHDKAIQLLEQAYKLVFIVDITEEKYFILTSNICISLSEQCKEIGKKDESLKSLMQGIQILNNKKVKSKYEYLALASLYSNVALFFYDLNDYNKALYYYEKALSLTESNSPSPCLLSNSLQIDLTEIYDRLGQYENSLDMLILTRNCLQNYFGKNDKSLMLVNFRLASLYLSLSINDDALKYYNEAKRIIEINKVAYPRIKNNYLELGIGYINLNKDSLGIDYLKRFLDYSTNAFDRNTASTGIAIAQLNKGEYKKSLRILNEYLNTSEQHISKYELKTLYRSMSTMYESLEKTDSSFVYFQKFMDIKNTEEFDSEALPLFYKFKSKHYADSIILNEIPSQIKYLNESFLFLSHEQKLSYIKRVKNTYRELFSLLSEINSPKKSELAADLLLNTKAIALDYNISTQDIIKNIGSEYLKNSIDSLRKINKDLADADIFNGKISTLKIQSKDSLIQKRAELSQRISNNNKIKSILERKRFSWQTIQNKLQNDEAVIDFIDFHFHPKGECNLENPTMYYAVIITKDISKPQFVRITDRKALVRLLKKHKNALPYYLNEKRNRKALYETLWQPLEPYLEGIKTVHISPSGILHRVPFESLQDTEDEYLAVRYEFHYYSAIRDMLKKKPQKATYKDMILIGDILYDLDNKDKEKKEGVVLREGNDPLPGTLDEVINIDSISQRAGVTTIILTRDAASEDTVQYFVQERAPSIIHFATHGVFLPRLKKQHDKSDLIGTRNLLRVADNPLQRSALMLYGANETWTKGRPILGSGEDGILTALEVTALDLQNTDLVVLSACSTGLGNVHNTEGVFGLQRAFKLAGVDYVVASLWDVNDGATKDLMVEFYKNLLELKQDPATALRNAKHEFMKDDPENWAGFILIE